MSSRTFSLCPVCLEQIEAERIRLGDELYLDKTCPRHGNFRTLIWRGEPSFDSWYQPKETPPQTAVPLKTISQQTIPQQTISQQTIHLQTIPTKTAPRQAPLTQVDRGCPFDCGLCPDHRQQSCCVLLEVTSRCNLSCPICFADAGKASSDPTLDEIKEQLQILLKTAGKCNLQLSGGEPTVRDNLPQIIELARSLGFSYIQLNTNGLRLAEETGYTDQLKAAGLSSVFMQFDGLEDGIYERTRGRKLLAVKKKAIENCSRSRLGVVLVPTLVPGLNTDAIGSIIRFALEGLPVIRGVHFQPISYFGRYPSPPQDKDRITLPEVLSAIESQTGQLMKKENFVASGCENALCSFHGDFVLLEDGTLRPLSSSANSCCCKGDEGEAVVKARNYVANRWELKEPVTSCCRPEKQADSPSLDDLLYRLNNYRFSITCMAFMDAYNLDLERLKDCCLHIISGGKIIPFCAYNLTDMQGNSPYRSGKF